jgi:hypothetical protein
VILVPRAPSLQAIKNLPKARPVPVKLEMAFIHSSWRPTPLNRTQLEVAPRVESSLRTGPGGRATLGGLSGAAPLNIPTGTVPQRAHGEY